MYNNDPYHDEIETDDFRKRARKLTRRALDTLDEVMGDPEAKTAARVRAAEVVLAHGHGMPERRTTNKTDITVYDGRQAHLEALKNHSKRVAELPAPENKIIDVTPVKSEFEE